MKENYATNIRILIIDKFFDSYVNYYSLNVHHKLQSTRNSYSLPNFRLIS